MFPPPPPTMHSLPRNASHQHYTGTGLPLTRSVSLMSASTLTRSASSSGDTLGFSGEGLRGPFKTMVVCGADGMGKSAFAREFCRWGVARRT